MKNVELLPAAVADGDEAYRWYEERSPNAAARFRDELDRAVDEIAEHPERWPTYIRGTRRFRLWKFPFYVVYLIEESRVLIISIAHAARSPGFWGSRLP